MSSTEQQTERVQVVPGYNSVYVNQIWQRPMFMFILHYKNNQEYGGKLMCTHKEIQKILALTKRIKSFKL